ncbi:MAG: hypothetical protein Q7V63_01760 [Gammaproteobacteria bacterium]|nr:hypothetical protein [Gammaproteobacteria bacterium]
MLGLLQIAPLFKKDFERLINQAKGHKEYWEYLNEEWAEIESLEDIRRFSQNRIEEELEFIRFADPFIEEMIAAAQLYLKIHTLFAEKRSKEFYIAWIEHRLDALATSLRGEQYKTYLSLADNNDHPYMDLLKLMCLEASHIALSIKPEARIQLEDHLRLWKVYNLTKKYAAITEHLSERHYSLIVKAIKADACSLAIFDSIVNERSLSARAARTSNSTLSVESGLDESVDSAAGAWPSVFCHAHITKNAKLSGEISCKR